MFFDFFVDLFNLQTLYEVRYAGERKDVFDLVFLENCNSKGKARGTKSWRRARKWMKNGMQLVVVGCAPNTDKIKEIFSGIKAIEHNKVMMENKNLHYLGVSGKKYKYL